MSWPINEVARMSGVSSRTLRHYQSIGLLEPESTEFGGRRLYGRPELLRLQEILVLRELGLPLKTIGDVLDSRDPEVRRRALTAHHEALRAERSRLDRLIRTVAKTIEGDEMTPEEMFEGLKENPYEVEARERWGDAAVDASKEKLGELTPEEVTSLRYGFAPVHDRIEALHAEGARLDDPRVTEALDEHHRLVSLAWEPSPEAYAGLGRMYVEDPRFRETIGRGNDAMVEYLRDAMAVYADGRLS